jgi:hypothetical protein
MSRLLVRRPASYPKEVMMVKVPGPEKETRGKDRCMMGEREEVCLARRKHQGRHGHHGHVEEQVLSLWRERSVRCHWNQHHRLPRHHYFLGPGYIYDDVPKLLYTPFHTSLAATKPIIRQEVSSSSSRDRNRPPCTRRERKSLPRKERMAP